jgi:ribonuclease BN (tRNA processing enzyme)
MRITVLGGSGAYPTADKGCSGYLFRHDDFVLLVDPGYATYQALLRHHAPGDIGAVVVTHGHPDHCADLHPLLRARALAGLGSLPLFAPGGALDAVLALDAPAMLDGAYAVSSLPLDGRITVGPFTVDTMRTPHFVPNAGLRLTTGDGSVAYTGDSGPHAPFAAFADGVDLLIAEATRATSVPPRQSGNLSSALDAGRLAAAAHARALWLTHLWPGSDPAEHLAAAATGYAGPTAVATPHLEISLGSERTEGHNHS